MVQVSIDIDAANVVVAQMYRFVEEVISQRTAAGHAAELALGDTSALHLLDEPLALITDSARDLKARVALAVAIDSVRAGIGSPGTVTVTFETSGPTETIGDVKSYLGAQLATSLAALDPHNRVLNHQDVQRLDQYATLLSRYADDEAVMGALFATLGPEATVQVPVMLHSLSTAYATQLGSKSDQDLMWNTDTPMTVHIDALNQQFMESFGTGLATASSSQAFRESHADFARGLAGAVTADGTGAGWGLSQVLRHGTYDATFLADVGAGLYDWEKTQTGPVWSVQADSQVMDWRLGTDDPGHYYDPFVGLFEAMGRTPQGAVDFFNPDNGGPDATARAKYFIQDRTWRADDFNALGQALDAAATAPAFRGPNASLARQTQSAWVASATITYLSQRAPGLHDRRIGDAAKDSLGHILATYIVDVGRVASGTSGELGVYRTPAGDPWLVGLPIGAGFDEHNLRTVLSEVLTDDGAVAEVAKANQSWNAYRINYAAEHWGGDYADMALLQSAVWSSGQTTGYVLGAMGVGLEAKAKESDERAKMFLDISSDVIGLVPTGGTATSFIANQALSAGKDNLSNRWTGNQSRVAGEQLEVREVATLDLQMAVAVAMAEHGKLPLTSQTDELGVRYAWFPAGGGFDASALADPKVRAAFQFWLNNTGEPGTPVKTLLDQAASHFGDGVDSAQGRK
jgi:hypothetical protein